MALFVLQRGTHKATDPKTGERRTFTRGETVDLTPAAAKAFSDKFKSVDVVKAEAEVAAAQLSTIKQMENETNKVKSKSKTDKESGASESGESPASDQKDGDGVNLQNVAPQGQHALAGAASQVPAGKTVASK